MENLEKILKSLRELEAKLFRHVLGYSFVFPLLAILAQYDKFDAPFHALTELLAGTLGAAGILSGYLGDLKHPVETQDELLDFRPHFSGVLVTLSLVISAILFYGFYSFARQASQVCLVFLCLAVFIFFRGMTVAVLTIAKVDLQQRTWKAMNEESRNHWRNRLKTYQKALAIANEMKIEADMFDSKLATTLKEMQKQQRRQRLQSLLTSLGRQTFALRRKLGLVSIQEVAKQAKLDAAIQALGEEWDRETHHANISQIHEAHKILTDAGFEFVEVPFGAHLVPKLEV